MTARGVFFRSLVLAALVALVGTGVVFAADKVNVMPDRQAHPGVVIEVFGNACSPPGCTALPGGATAAAETYTWSFTGSNVLVNGSPPPVSFPAVYTDDHFINLNTTFTLTGGSTRETVTATLTVTGVGSDSDTVTIDVVDCPADPICDTPLEEQAVDVNIAIEQAGKYLYKNQNANGSWTNAGPIETCATTGYAVWALSNQGHLATNNFDTDIYAEFVQRGINFILSNTAPQGVIVQPNIGSPDGNGNGLIYSLCGPSNNFPVGYANPIVTASIIAAYSAAGASANLVPAGSVPGQPAGYTYFDLVADSVDWTAYAQEDSLVPSNRGGWRYTANFGSSDGSVDGWHCVAIEGFEAVFGGTVNPLIKTELEHRIDGFQCDVGAQVGLGAYGSGCSAIDTVSGGFNGRATTGALLSCLVTVTTGGYSPTLLDGGALSNATFPDTTSRINAAVTHLGRAWLYPAGLSPITGFLDGNRSNPYAMWVNARAMRLNGTASLTNGGISFDWETGESPLASGTVLPPGDPREGYFAYLVRNQDPDGTWRENTFGDYNDNFEAANDLLVLLPTVFGPPQAECDPDPRTQGYWHRQCLGMSSSDPVCPGIDPGRNGRGPQQPNDPDFCPELYNCSNEALEDLGFFGLLTCDALNADPPSDPCEKALKQFDALLLNRCSDRLQNTCEVDVSAEGCTSTTVGALIDEIADLIHNGDCKTAAACAGAVNEGDALAGDGGGGDPELGTSETGTELSGDPGQSDPEVPSRPQRPRHELDRDDNPLNPGDSPRKPSRRQPRKE